MEARSEWRGREREKEPTKERREREKAKMEFKKSEQEEWNKQVTHLAPHPPTPPPPLSPVHSCSSAPLLVAGARPSTRRGGEEEAFGEE